MGFHAHPSLTYLGIELDTVLIELRLPRDKLTDLITTLHQWQDKKKCTKRDLLSLIGKLSFATKSILSGRIFLCRLIDISTTVSKLRHHISLNLDARLNLAWWQEFLPTWNGKYKILAPKVIPPPSLNLFTDASGQLGFGIHNGGHWISQLWPAEFKHYSIQWNELFPIYVTCLVWGQSLRGRKLLFNYDNQAVVEIWSAKNSKCSSIMSLLHRIFFLSAKYELSLNASHILGTDNSIADALSHSQMTRFFLLAPQADHVSTPLDSACMECLSARADYYVTKS